MIVNLLRFSPAVAMKPKLTVKVKKQTKKKKREGKKDYSALVCLPAERRLVQSDVLSLNLQKSLAYSLSAHELETVWTGSEGGATDFPAVEEE